jgi:hypothetical protein
MERTLQRWLKNRLSDTTIFDDEEDPNEPDDE